MKKLRVLLLTLCVAVFMCGFTVTAHAGGGDEYIEPTDQWEGLEEPTPTTEPGVGFSDEGNLVTRDLLYDEHTNKQFITVQAQAGTSIPAASIAASRSASSTMLKKYVSYCSPSSSTGLS